MHDSPNLLYLISLWPQYSLGSPIQMNLRSFVIIVGFVASNLTRFLGRKEMGSRFNREACFPKPLARTDVRVECPECPFSLEEMNTSKHLANRAQVFFFCLFCFFFVLTKENSRFVPWIFTGCPECRWKREWCMLQIQESEEPDVLSTMALDF